MTFPNNVLYDPELLNQLDFESVSNVFKKPISVKNIGEPGLVLRPLELEDFDKGYVQTLEQVVIVGVITKEDFERQFLAMKKAGGYYITVIEDTTTNKIIGTATLQTELKIVHRCGLRGQLEDVAIDKNYRGKELGKLIVMAVTLLAKHIGCFKVCLDCRDTTVKFYNILGYNCEAGNANSMVTRFPELPY